MTEKIKILLLAVLLAMGLMLASFLAGWKIRGEQMQPHDVPIADTTITTTMDAVTLVGDEGNVDSIVWKPYPVPYPIHDTTFVFVGNTDSFYVNLPYEYKHMSKKDTLDVWYSGVDAKIDSAKVYIRNTTEIIRQPYEVAKMPRLTLDLGAAAFYHESRINPCLVGEMRYNARKTTFSAYGAVNHEGKWGAGVGVTYRMNIIK